MAICKHRDLATGVSSHANEVGYSRPTTQQRITATQPSGQVSSKSGDLHGVPPDSTFPAPLVLPGDELSCNPKYPPQSLRSWIQGTYRNPVTARRSTIYLVPPPTVDASVSFVQAWAQPEGVKGRRPELPATQHVLEYLQAFYHGLEVKMLPADEPRFAAWQDGSRKKRVESRKLPPISLAMGTVATRIRSRASYDGTFAGQLNLNDLLDAAINLLPDDAYAMLMLVEHDLYEDEDDDFCCGRAYGGSRIAVVSMARYNPLLDDTQEVEREHPWPASHCKAFVDGSCSGHFSPPPRKKARKGTSSEEVALPTKKTAMAAAVAAHCRLKKPTSTEDLSNVWLGRVCKTGSHELGHCFGLDHCIYYACLMQGTTGLSEDAGQPPYLCPVDSAKLTRATGAVYEIERDKALLGFCEKFGKDRLFSAFAAWLRFRLDEEER